MSWFWLILLCLAGGGGGSAWLQGLGESAAEGTPDGWARLEAKVPFRRSDLLGSLPPSSKSYALDHFQGLHASKPSSKWDLELDLGESGEARIVLAGHVPRIQPGKAPSTAGNQLIGDGLFLSRAGAGEINALAFGKGERQPLRCQGSLPPPTRSTYSLSLTKTTNGFTAESDGKRLECHSAKKKGRPIIMAGLNRIRVIKSTIDSAEFQSPFLPSPGLIGALLGALFVLGIWRIERRLGADSRIAALTSTPLLLSWSLQRADRMQIVEDMRMPGLSESSLALVVPLTLALALKLLHHAGRLARTAKSTRHGLVKAALVCGIGFLCLSIAAQPQWLTATAYFSLAGIFLGLLIGINALAHRVRAVNLLSLLLLSLFLLSMEWGVRWTHTGITWTPNGRMNHDMQIGWTRSTLSDFEALDLAEETDGYPSSGYPVNIQSPEAKPRWICLGSSATGGAFQNDNLNEFYPARIQDLLQDTAQILNQGVGGWTSFHIARYFEREIEGLQPDIVSVYIGHNDILTRSARPYKDLYAHWKSHGEPTTPLPTIRLFQGLRFFLSSALQQASSIAVPVEDARENLLSVHKIAQQQGAKLLLIPEAITPDSSSLLDYSAMLKDLADAHSDIAYFDAPSLLLHDGGDHFLDDVHLSETGHRLLAKALVDKVQGLGWLNDSEGLDESSD